MEKLWRIISKRIARLLVALSLLFYGHAAASDLDNARRLFNTGDYDTAQSMAAALETADGYILASEALTAKILLGHFEKPNEPAKAARKLAEKALELDPDNLNAKFQQAVTFGLETQSTGVLKAWRKKLPRRMYEMIEALHSEAPNDPRSQALFGAWHLGIVHKVGERNAYKWYEASAEKGKAYYEKAWLAGDDIVIMSNYAASTILLDNPDYAMKILATVMALTPENVAEEDMQKRTAALAAAHADPKKFKKAAKAFLSNKPF